MIVVLIIAAIFINALQQHRAKVESERRAEMSRQRVIVDETENIIMACSSMPVSARLMQILYKRLYNALKAMGDAGAGGTDIKRRLDEAEKRTQEEIPETQSLNEFSLPDNDKMIIQYIQAVKKLRTLLRSEHSKGNVDTRSFIEEDKALERLQLKTNVETLIKRGRGAMQSGMLGSARQYFEKAIGALEGQTQRDEYINARLNQLNEWLESIQNNLKSANAEDRAKRKEEERDELDELFAPKKKW